MTRSLLRAALVAGLALAASSGCRKKEESASTQDAGSEASARPAAPRTGVKVPLPQGWSAQVAADGSFQAGPPGKPILRVDIRPGEGEKMPNSDTLHQELLKKMPEQAISLDQEEDEPNVALLRVTLAPKLADGGVGPHAPALFGARRVGNDLFLCATLPGITYEDVRLAAESCRNIEVQPAPR